VIAIDTEERLKPGRDRRHPTLLLTGLVWAVAAGLASTIVIAIAVH
jgi:hypothetical protein